MTIKFSCPHCKKAWQVEDRLAGKQAVCKNCKQKMTNPAAAPEQYGNGKAAAGPAAPAPSVAEVEAAAAAAFADEPPPKEEAKPAAVTTIELRCMYCDEAVRFP